MENEKLAVAKKQLFILLWIDIFLTALVCINAFATVGTLQEIRAGHRYADQALLDSFKFWDGFSRLQLLTVIGVGIGLVRWLNACYRYADESLGLVGLKNSGWTVWGWVIPFINLVKPYQIISELYKAGSDKQTAREDWRQTPGSGALLAWWIFWIIAHLIMLNLIIMSTQSTPSLRSAIRVAELQGFVCLIAIAVSGLWLWVANLITKRLLARHQAITISSDTTKSHSSMSMPMSQPASVPTLPTNPSHVETSATTPHNTRSPNAADAATITIDEDAIYTTVANELETGNTDKGLWARLYADLDGDEKKVKVAYIKQRAEKLIAAEYSRIEEGRRLSEIMRVKSEQLASSAGVTLDQAREMLQLGVTKVGEKFAFNEYRYDRLSDALEYARKQSRHHS